MAETPFDPGPFIAAAKRELKDNNNVARHFDAMRDRARRSVDAITDKHAKTGAVVPELEFDAIRSGSFRGESTFQARQRAWKSY